MKATSLARVNVSGVNTEPVPAQTEKDQTTHSCPKSYKTLAIILGVILVLVLLCCVVAFVRYRKGVAVAILPQPPAAVQRQVLDVLTTPPASALAAPPIAPTLGGVIDSGSRFAFADLV